MNVLLSIIVPFFNSVQKSKTLLQTISALNCEHYADIEIIFVDDGSTDDTLTILHDTKNNTDLSIHVISQENKGPGGARNTGLANANGEYVWFVDSDDNIFPEAIDVLRDLRSNQYDFIDFDYTDYRTERINSMSLEYKAHHYPSNEVPPSLIHHFGRICSKIIKKNFMVTHNISYPEYCIYEDNLLVMVYPLFSKNFFKSDTIGYQHIEEFDSITRGSNFNIRYFDRLLTAYLGLKITNDQYQGEVKELIIKRFNNLFLFYTICHLLGTGKPKLYCYLPRILQFYREIAKELGLPKFNIIKHIASKRKETSTVKFILYSFVLLSIYPYAFFFKNQKEYFMNLNQQAWKGNRITITQPND